MTESNPFPSSCSRFALEVIAGAAVHILSAVLVDVLRFEPLTRRVVYRM